MPSRPLRVLLLASVALGGARHAAAQARPTPGYAAPSAAAQRALEADAIARPSPDSAAAYSRVLSGATHVAGTDAQAATRDFVIGKMREWGIDTEVRTYSVYLPHATAVRLWRVSPDEKELPLAEPPIPGDPTSSLPQYPTVNGYSAAGDVRGEVVYVNYGLVEDYARLDSMGVSVKGRIAIARYGRSFRGIKAREAERHGAIALLMYSDPADDGFKRGEVYPAGPMRPAGGVQRGSVFNGAGDPSTPGYASVRGARRVPAARMAVPRIPVIPISYGNAAELMRGVTGKAVPQGWQGGMDFPYHLGPGPVSARVMVQTDSETRPYKDIWNTLGTIRGSEMPDQLVIVGAHRDAWGPGGADNVSGTVSVLEMARAITQQVRAGNRPRRTIVFATWDAEEWGLIGSTEHVEQDSARLRNGAVVYINQDVSANGSGFNAAGTPSLRALLRDVARMVPDPDSAGSVYDVWRRTEKVAADSLEPPVGDPGGGSDFAGFYNHLGIPHSDWSWNGPWGVYHSHYDSYDWMSRFGDPGFKRQAASARIGAAFVLRMANAEVLPYDYAEYARTMAGYIPRLDSLFAQRKWDVSADPLRGAISRMERAAGMFARARDEALAQGALPRRKRERVNRLLMRVERVMARPSGLKSRPWYRSLIYASDVDNGYSTMIFPGIGEAIRGNRREEAERELGDLAQRFVVAANALVAATEELDAEER